MNFSLNQSLSTFVSLAAATFLVSCAAPKTTDQISDPIEPVNRVIHGFNGVVDTFAIEPAARGYRAAVPKPARKGVRNFLRNLNAPTNFANEVLQGDFDGAGHVLTRTSVNTFIGLGGLIDVAAHEGLEHTHEDFGQTLAVWGIGHGPYLVAPLLGPGSLRDYTGMAVDVYADPLNRWLHNTDEDEWIYARTAATVIDNREALLEVLEDLQANSIDFYATLRSVYVQNRNDEILDGKSNNNYPEFE